MPAPLQFPLSRTEYDRKVRWGRVAFDPDPAILIRRDESGRLLAEGGNWTSCDLLARAGFTETGQSTRERREYALADPYINEAGACALAVGALTVADYPVTVDPALFAEPIDLLGRLPTPALLGAVAGLPAHRSPGMIDNLTHILLDPRVGALQRVRLALDTLAARAGDRDDATTAGHLSRAPKTVATAAHLRRAAHALATAVDAHSDHQPGAPLPAASPTPAPRIAAGGAERPVTTLRDDGGLIVAENVPRGAGAHLEWAGFGESAFVPRHQLPLGGAEWFVQERCIRAVRALAAAGYPVVVETPLLASPTSVLGPWSTPDVADVVDRLTDRADPADAPALAHCLLGRDGLVQRVHEHLDNLAAGLARHGALTRAEHVVLVATLVGSALTDTPTPPAGAVTAAARTRTRRSTKPSTPPAPPATVTPPAAPAPRR
ncbi:hypothetical protein [Streptomyces sp. SID3343]|uniref:hypothetical protein n=1 Tax=Streptomyces sp. SID3343 TaxID=2690260 RepID=UPI00136C4343|nr:hypothetical protein [Streptomyces sp. SID3343]MYV97296.1 hypothetical protein [Streptomyces sp. SID3343]